MPVVMMSPARNVISREANEISSSQAMLTFLVDPSTRTSPETRLTMRTSERSPASSLVTIAGPRIAKPSSHLPLSQSMNPSISLSRRPGGGTASSRPETSLQIVKPITWSIA